MPFTVEIQDQRFEFLSVFLRLSLRMILQARSLQYRTKKAATQTPRQNQLIIAPSGHKNIGRDHHIIFGFDCKLAAVHDRWPPFRCLRLTNITDRACGINVGQIVSLNIYSETQRQKTRKKPCAAAFPAHKALRIAMLIYFVSHPRVLSF